ncbi:acetolactate synthase small subunit [Acidaminococcus sp. NSJ-142]|jgi:acetolactate synthase-1/3 small subunit|uniref:acetolactate synthase small subunit n=1 Tax=Acidaminococcus TaxID=904 RepID=UPI000CF84FED|nr:MULTISPECIES: acetolactate synthase small subunit [Acidaminococcus]MCD2434490.1 acetolactate synthase small subunit [Acidaminococcus hominis]MCH4096884.1 acetolactate synthase small subunit [Acidaminococcus provencensis]RHK03775.1 acetolactate synthase small subunit [Acidaminococcus sp. AM05-11]
MQWQHLALLVNNKPGVLAHVAGLLARRNINIECLNVGYTDLAEISRINLMVEVDTRFALDQAINQLSQLIDVIAVVNLDDQPLVSYELTLIKVSSPTAQIREELTNIAGLFHAKIVDVYPESLIFRLTGREDHIKALLQLLRAYTILEIATTGQISLGRGPHTVKETALAKA